MNINQVRYFVLVHDCHSFSAAAKKRGISVQAVSKAVGELEREVGCNLLARSSKGVVATKAGRAFYQRARLAVNAFDALEKFSPAELLDTHTGPIKLALCSPSFENSDALLKSFMAFFRKTTGLTFDLRLADVRTAQSKLEDGALDALVTIGTYEHKGCECTTLGTLPTGIRVAPSHPLVGKDVVTLEDLRAYPAGESAIIDDFNDSIFHLYKEAGALGEVERLDTVSEESKDFMVDRNGYFFSALFPQITGQEGSLVLIPIEPTQAIRVPICVITLEGHMTPEIEAVRSLMLQGGALK